MARNYHIKEIRTVPDGKYSDYFGIVGQEVRLDVDNLIMFKPFRMVGKQLTITTKALLEKMEINGELCLTTENAMYFLV